MNMIRPILTDADHQKALRRIEALMDAEPGSEEGSELDVLATLVERYEAEHEPIEAPDPVAAILFRMEQGGHTRKDLERLLGGKARVSEILNGKRKLTVQMIRRLHEQWGISTDSLIGTAKRKKRRPALGGASIVREAETQYVDSRPGGTADPAELLPLGAISPSNFERFCVALLAASGFTNAHVYGRNGDRQLGIDIEATHAKGGRWTFQCKRWQEFDIADAKKVVAANRKRADRHVLLLACEASAKLRDYFARSTMARWELWDVVDVSQRVRALPPFRGRRVISGHFSRTYADRYFGTAASIFDDAVPSLRSQLDLVGGAEAPFVGHDIELAQARAALSRAGTVILSGAGGSGKTRILFELAKEMGDQSCLRTLVPLVEEALDELPERTVVIVDDAHRSDDLRRLLAGMMKRPDLRLILATRPHGVTTVLDAIRSRPSWSIAPVINIDPLDEASTETLVRALLAKSEASLVERVAQKVSGSPFFAVLTCRLIRRGRLKFPDDPGSDEEFQRQVLVHFERDLLENVRLPVPTPETFLGVLAAVQPIDVRSDAVIERISSLLGEGVRSSQVDQAIRMLCDAGTLSGPTRALRFNPDLLGDYVLDKACVRADGSLSRFVEEVIDAFGEYESNVVRNLAEVDWRLRGRGSRTSLLDRFWTQFRTKLRGLSGTNRTAQIASLGRIAFFQPEQSLLLIEEELQRDRDAVAEFTESLFALAHHWEYLDRAADLLWDAARRLNDEGALKKLRELATWERDKPVEFNRRVLQCVQRWMGKVGAFDSPKTPLHVLEPLLAKHGDRSYSRTEDTITLESFALSATNLGPVVQEATASLVNLAGTADLRTAVHAARLLADAFDPPRLRLGGEYPKDESTRWDDLRIALLPFAQRVAERAHPLVRLELARGIRWNGSRDSARTLRDACRKIWTTVSSDPAVRPYRLLTAGGAHGLDFDLDREVDFAEKEDAYRREVIECVREELQTAGIAGFIAALEFRCEEVARAGGSQNPFLILLELRELIPTEELANGLDEAIRSPHLRDSVAGMWRPLREQDPARAEEVAMKLEATNASAASQLYAYMQWESAPPMFDLERLRRLARAGTRIAPALFGLAKTHPAIACDLFLEVPLEKSSEIHELFALLTEGGIPMERDGLERLLSKVKQLPRLDDYWVEDFLVRAAKQSPEEVFDLIMERAQHGVLLDFDDRRKRPSFSTEVLKDKLRDAVRTVEIAEGGRWTLVRAICRLLENADASVWDTILEPALENPTQERILIAADLFATRGTAALDSAFLRTFLHAANSLGEETLRAASSRLIGGLLPSGGIIRHVSSQCRHIAERARRAAPSEPDPLVGRFLYDLAHGAEASADRWRDLGLGS